MRRISLTAVALFLLCGLLLSQQGRSVNLTGKGLLEMMKSSKSEDRAYARGYVAGVYCVSRNLTTVPDDETMKKVEESAMKFLEENPTKLSQPANGLLKEAWSKASPTGKN